MFLVFVANMKLPVDADEIRTNRSEMLMSMNCLKINLCVLDMDIEFKDVVVMLGWW